jgi:glycogen(starch) synthase
MRLCIVTAEYAGVSSYTGGIGVQYADLAPELVRQGHDVHVVARGDGSSRVEHVDGVIVHLLAMAGVSGPLSDSRDLVGRSLAVDRLLRDIGPFDVLESADWQAECWSYSKRHTSGPLVTALHGSMLQRHLSSMSGLRKSSVAMRTVVQQRMEREQARRSDLLIAPTREALDEAVAGWRFAPGSGQVVPNMVDTARVRSLAERPTRVELPSGGPVVGYFGRLEVVKGVHILGEAMREVWTRWPSASLVLIGRDGRWKKSRMSERVRELAGSNADRVHLLDNLPHEQLFSVLSHVDVVALPSLWESFGNTAVEALAIGKPLVASDLGAFREYFESGQHGLSVPPGDAAALARALDRLIADPELAARCGEAGRTAADSFAVDAVSRLHAQTLARVAGRAARPALDGRAPATRLAQPIA